MLVFRIEVVILLKTSILKLLVVSHNEEQNSENLLANLDLIKEVRSDAKLKTSLNQ